MKYSTDIKKHWSWMDGKCLELFKLYVIEISKGIESSENIISYNKKLTHRQQGKITGYASCLLEVNYMINEDE